MRRRWMVAVVVALSFVVLSAEAKIVFRATFDNSSLSDSFGAPANNMAALKWSDGKHAGALWFYAGNIDYQSAVPLSFREPLTFGLWVKPAVPVGTTSVVALGNVRQLPGHWSLGLSNNRISLATMRQSEDHLSVAKLPRNEWTHIAAVIERTEARLYINGVLDSVVALLANPVPARLVYYVEGVRIGGKRPTNAILPLELNALEQSLGGGFSLDPLELLNPPEGGAEFDLRELNALERSLLNALETSLTRLEGFPLDSEQFDQAIRSLAQFRTTYVGSVDDVFVADAAMTEGEIVALMNGGDAVPTPVNPRGNLATQWAKVKSLR